MKKNNRVLLGMSGGVDSSVAAFLLQEEGYEVVGAHIEMWEADPAHSSSRSCSSLTAVNDARRIAEKLGIEFHMLDFKDIFKKKVIDYFTEEYKEGRTPNPCIQCNKNIKFHELLNKAFQLDCYYIATGHYAKIDYDKKSDRYLLRKSITDEKDQTYALYNITQKQLRHTLMPLGDYNKEDIRRIAEKMDMDIANKPDSQEICFIPDNDYGNYIKESTKGKIKKGKFVDKEGNILGEHRGIIYYTIGQRKGLGIALGRPVFVVEIKARENQVVLGDSTDVFSHKLIASNINLIPFEHVYNNKKNFTAKVRYNAKADRCTITQIDNDKLEIVFDKAQRAITPGQSVVLYDDDMVVGGGIIIKNEKIT